MVRIVPFALSFVLISAIQSLLPMQAEPPVALFVNELCHYNKSAVCPGILTGGKGQELVAVFSGYTRIVK